MDISKIIIAICSLLFFMVGADKFLFFLEPPCSLASSISPLAWKTIGTLQIAAGVFIWFHKLTKYVTGFFLVFMLVFTIVHLTQNTYDIGGSTFMAALLALLTWNPNFLRAHNK